MEQKTIPPKLHPWALCPAGEHWRRSHPKHLRTKTVRVGGHCVKNIGNQEIFHLDELIEISDRNFKNLAGSSYPSSNALGFKLGNDFDLQIAGWTQFWNEVFKPKVPLDPNWIKALMTSESRIKMNASKNSHGGQAVGLIQITEVTRKILSDPNGKLKDALVQIFIRDLSHPTVNLAAGIRWLHRKKQLLEKRLNREVRRREAIVEHKGLRQQLGKFEKADRVMKNPSDYYQSLQKNP